MMNVSKFMSCVAALTCALGSARADTVEDLVRLEMATNSVPGIAIVIVRDGGTSRVQGFGLANLEHSVPVHADTLFKTGALGMQFTAAAVMRLVEEGKLSLDASIRQYLPEAPRKWQPVTIRQLLTHTSGLPATPNGEFRTEYTDAELLNIIAAEELNFPAGSKWRFSYAGYIVLGFAMKRVTGEQTYGDMLKRRIFMPLGMTTARGIDELAVVPNRASGYELREGTLRNAEWVSATANSTADGSLYISAMDYAAWVAGMARGQTLSPGSWEAMTTPVRLSGGATCPYGFGWNLAQSGSRRILSHGGSWQGFQTYALRFPAEKLTVAVLANGEVANVRDLATKIVAATDPSLALPDGKPVDGADARAVARFRKVLDNLAANKVVATDFSGYAKLDVTELTAQYAQMLSSLGAVKQFAQFAVADICGGTEYRLRALMEKGTADMRVRLGPDGRIDDLEITPVASWTSPL